MFPLLSRSWLLTFSFEFTEPHTAIWCNEQTVRHSSPCGAGEFVRKHTFGTGVFTDSGFNVFL